MSAPQTNEPVAIQQKISALIVKPTLAVAAKMADLYQQRRKEALDVSESLDKTFEKIEAGFHGVILLSLTTEADVVPLSNFFRTTQHQRKSEQVKVVILSKINNTKLKQAFQRMGAAEFLIEPLTPSTLFFRTVYFMSQMQATQEKAKEDKSKRVRSNGSFGGDDNEKISVSSFQTSTEVIADDTWLVRGVPPKKVGVQWVIESEGPDPDSGGWEFTGLDSHRQEQWSWRPHDESGKATGDEDTGWKFCGNRPTFQPENKKWKFVGNAPDLSYEKDGERAGSKIKTDPEAGIILAADNKEAEDKIKASQAIGEKVKKKREEEHRKLQAAAEAAQAERMLSQMTDKDNVDKNRKAAGKLNDENDRASQRARSATGAESGIDDGDDQAGGSGRSAKGESLNAKGAKGIAEKAGRNSIASGESDEIDENGISLRKSAQKKDDEDLARAKSSLQEDDDEDGLSSGSKKRDAAEKAERKAAGEIDDDSVGGKAAAKSALAKDRAGRDMTPAERDVAEREAREKQDLQKAAKARDVAERAAKQEAANKEAAEQKKEAAERAEAKKTQRELEAKERADATHAEKKEAAERKRVEIEKKEREEKLRGEGKDSQLGAREREVQEREARENSASRGKSALEDEANAAARGKANEDDGGPSSVSGALARNRGKANMRAGELAEAETEIQKNYVFKRCNGKLRKSGALEKLDRVPSSELGSENGVWEPVGETGWIFMTPEMKSGDMAALQKAVRFVDKKKGSRAPIYDGKSQSWLFEPDQGPSTADYENLPNDYKDYLSNLTHKPLTEAEFENQKELKRQNDLTYETYEAFMDLGSITQEGAEELKTAKPAPASKPASHLGFFLRLSDMVSGRKGPDAIFTVMLNYLAQSLQASRATIYTVVVQGSPHMVNMEFTTGDPGSVQHLIDLRLTHFADIFDVEQARVVSGDEGNALFITPLVRHIPSRTELGLLVVQFPFRPEELLSENSHLLAQTTKQFRTLLARHLMEQKKLAAA